MKFATATRIRAPSWVFRSYSWIQTGEPEGVVLGNLNDETVGAMWNSPRMRQYREGHRRRLEEMIPVCRGCPGRT